MYRYKKTPRLGCFNLAGSDKVAGEEYQHAADYNLEDREGKIHLHESIADKCDRHQFYADDKVSDVQSGFQIVKQEGKGVENAADKSHGARNKSPLDRMAASGVFAGIGQAFGKTHGYASAGCGRQAD